MASWITVNDCTFDICSTVMHCIEADDMAIVASAMYLGLAIVEKEFSEGRLVDMQACKFDDIGFKWPALRDGASILASRIREMDHD
jgi:hypothetical protein